MKATRWYKSDGGSEPGKSTWETWWLAPLPRSSSSAVYVCVQVEGFNPGCLPCLEAFRGLALSQSTWAEDHFGEPAHDPAPKLTDVYHTPSMLTFGRPE